jgi:AbrB family looped-hinge helix DNA binding protein
MNAKVSRKGWVVIPSHLRKKYALHPGAEVEFVDYGGVLALVPKLENPVERAAGMLAGGGRSLTKALLEEHRQELENERK